VPKRKHDYHVRGGLVATARCTVCGGSYTKGEYSEHVKRSHHGAVYHKTLGHLRQRGQA
jgi:hypothetical protein